MTTGNKQLSIDGRWHVVREHFCFLPLQLSHFDRLSRAAAYVCAACPTAATTLTRQNFARMDSQGHVIVSSQQFQALIACLQKELTLTQAAKIRQIHQRRLINLKQSAIHAVAASESVENLASWQQAWTLVAQAIAELAPYGLVTKILPDVYWKRLNKPLSKKERLADQGSADSEIYPYHLSSCALVEAVEKLLDQFQNLKKDESPGIEQFVVELHDFCRSNIGHGAKAWEQTGYENPRFVLETIGQLTLSSKAGNMAERPPGMPINYLAVLAKFQDAEQNSRLSPDPCWEERLLPAFTGWERELAYWTDQTDTQTTILRWAFLTAELPLLRRLSEYWRSQGEIRKPGDLLFATRQEIGSQTPLPQEIDRRRKAYQSLIHEARRSELVGAPDKLMNSGSPPAVSPSQPPPKLFSAVVQPTSRRSKEIFWGDSVSLPELRSGPAWLIDQGSLNYPDRPDTIVVARHLTPDQTPALLRAAAVVVEEGGLLQHASIIAREINIPCVVGCSGLVKQVRPGTFITVNGRDGRVELHSEGVIP